MNLENVVPREESRHRRPHMVSAHLYETGKINESKETDVGEWLSETGRRKGNGG